MNRVHQESHTSRTEDHIVIDLFARWEYLTVELAFLWKMVRIGYARREECKILGRSAFMGFLHYYWVCQRRDRYEG